MQTLINKPLSAIVTENHETAQVFNKYGLDFCCNGKRTLNAACEKKDLLIEDVIQELDAVLSKPAADSPVDHLSLTGLTEYITSKHHTYFRKNIPLILNYLLKVATRHGDRYPYMKRVFILFTQMRTELEFHLDKEEQVVFRKIRAVEQQPLAETHADYFQSAILLMEGEHEIAGTLMSKIRELTNNYEAPEDACTTFTLALNSLKAFEADLHQHVHLENNILFPRALALFNKHRA